MSASDPKRTKRAQGRLCVVFIHLDAVGNEAMVHEHAKRLFTSTRRPAL
jgi:hypothetical protein